MDTAGGTAEAVAGCSPALGELAAGAGTGEFAATFVTSVAVGVAGGVAVTTAVGGAFVDPGSPTGGAEELFAGPVGGVLLLGGAGGLLGEDGGDGGVLTTLGGGVGGGVTTSGVAGRLGGALVTSWIPMAGAGPAVSGTGLSGLPPK
jgi:hypothetical protein